MHQFSAETFRFAFVANLICHRETVEVKTDVIVVADQSVPVWNLFHLNWSAAALICSPVGTRTSGTQ